MTCRACGSENPSGAKFCIECGAKLVSGCPSCGAAFQPGAKFCGECGTRLGEGGPVIARTTSAVPANTERRLVTVLFADLVGFTTLAEGRDSEAVRELLGRYFDHGKEIVRRYGGTVEKFIGDAVMAVWGTPVAHEDDAERAVRAGLEMIDAVRSLSVDEGGDVLQARVGILTGEAAVDLRATDQGMVAGDLVNTASRLQSVAPPGTVLVGEATMTAASGAIAFEPVGDTELKGKAVPIPTWRATRVVGMVRGAGRTDVLEPPFVGRDTEFRLLRHLLHAAGRERRAHLVSLTGQAGIGKSRLAWELHKYIDGLVDDIYWHQGRSPSYGDGIAFWALGEMVRKRCALAERDDEATTRVRVAETVREYLVDEEERALVEPALLTLLGVGEPLPGGRERLFAGWRTLFERIAERGTVVLVFEDLHWADDAQLDFIEHLMEWSRDHPILVVTLSRPEILDRRPTWGIGQRNGSALALAPLAETDMRALLAGVAPGLPDRAVRTILERADGMPLYAVETLRMLVADGRLIAAPDGRLTPASELGQLDVPGSLRGLIAARLDGLDADDRAIVGDASVLGKTFVVPALSAISGVDPQTLDARLRRLSRRELLELNTDPRSPERGQWGFVQALIREVAYATLSKRDRRAKHLAAARYFESEGEEELAGALATHYLAAYEAVPEGPEGEAIAHQARIALRAAADRALAVGAPEQTVAHLRSALRIPGLSRGDEAELLERAGGAAELAGRYPEAESLWSEAVTRRRETGDTNALANALAGRGQALWAANRNEEAIEWLKAALDEVAGRVGDAARARLLALMGRLYMRISRPQDAFAVIDELLPIAERERLDEVLVDALATKAGALNQVGRPREAVSLLLGLLVDPSMSLHPRQELRVRGLQIVIDIDDDPKRAVQTAREGIEIARRLGLRQQLVYLALNGGEAALRTGDWTWAHEVTSELLGFDLEPSDVVIAGTTAASLALLSGLDASDQIDRVRAVSGDEAGFLLSTFANELRMWEAYAAGDARTVLEIATSSARSDVLNAPANYERAIRAAIWLDDAVTGRALLAELRAIGRRGGLVDAVDVGLEAGLQALEGAETEAIRAYEDAIDRMRGLSVAFAEGELALDAVRTLGGTAFAREMAGVARAIFERIGAGLYLRRLAALELAGSDAAGVERPSSSSVSRSA